VNNFLQELAALAEDAATPSAKASTTTAAPTKVINHVFFARNIPFDDKKEMSQRDAANLIQQAHDASEEVDTVAFGLELNDGEIVKVYVAADQAEAFEKAMSEMLGKEDDIEEAIDQLSGQFDIVSVEWPEQRQANANDQGQPEEGAEEGDGELDGNEEPPKESKIKLSFKLNKKKGEGNGEGNGEDDKEKGDSEDEADNLDLGDEEKPDSDLEDKDFDKEGDDTEDAGEEEEDEDGKPKKPKAKKKAPAPKKKDVKEAFDDNDPLWAFSSFLGEADKDHKLELKLEDIFRTALQRKIVKLIIHLDIPVQRLLQQKTAFRRGVREASLVLMHTSKGRQLLNRIVNELDASTDMSSHAAKEKELAGGHNKEDLKESDLHSKQISSVVEMLIELLKHLGVPSMVLETRKTALRQHLRHTAKRILQHSKLRQYVHAFHDMLVPHKKNEEEITEDVKLGNDAYIQLVSAVLTRLGVPDENINYKRSTLIRSLREKQKTVNVAVIKTRLIQLAKLLVANPEQQQANEELTIREDAIRRRARAENLGDWNIAKLNDKCELSVEDVKIQLSHHDTQQLARALENGFETIVKSGADNYDFKPIDHGREYAVYCQDDLDTYPDGILFTKKSVETFLALF